MNGADFNNLLTKIAAAIDGNWKKIRQNILQIGITTIFIAELMISDND